MTRAKWQATAVGAFGAWLTLIVCACVLAGVGQIDAGRICGLVSLPFLGLALFADARGHS